MIAPTRMELEMRLHGCNKIRWVIKKLLAQNKSAVNAIKTLKRK